MSLLIGDIYLPRSGDKPTNVIAAASAHLQTSRHHPNHVGIQFVQIGRDKGADVALAQLMQGAVGVSFLLYLCSGK